MDAKKYEKQGLVNIQTDVYLHKFIIFILNRIDYDSDNEEEEAKNEGFLYKVTQTKKLKKLWFRLIGKDLYCKLI